MADSSKRVKPAKPYPKFPLYAHASKRWAKKIKGKTHFFGKWDDWRSALDRYQHDVDYIQRGVKPPPMDDGGIDYLTLHSLCEQFLEQKRREVESVELSERSFKDYKRTTGLLLEKFGAKQSVVGLVPQDFASLRAELSARLGAVALGNEIGRCRVVFNYAYKNLLIDSPVRFGQAFQKPGKKTLKREKLTKPKKLFEVSELRTLYKAAKPQMRTFILLGLNGGLGNSDIGRLEFGHIQDGWIDYPRPKTLEDRRFPLWRETMEAIESTKQTRQPDNPLVFLTKYGKSWFKDDRDNPIANEFRKLLDGTGLYVKQRGFYALRHTFRTLADSCRDVVAINYIRGHVDESMGAVYRERIEDERLVAVTTHVYNQIKPIFEVAEK